MTTTMTRNTTMSAAQICRENGWGPGTRLVGDEGYGPTVIEVTAVGESNLLARVVSQDGFPTSGREGTWTLSCREWRLVSRPPFPKRLAAAARRAIRGV